MKKKKYKLKLKFKILLIALIVLPFIFAPNTYSKYSEKKTKHITISAVQPTYTVVFHANGGTGSMANQVFTYKTSQNLRSNEFTNGSLVFEEWTTNSDGSGNHYSDHQSVNNLTQTNGATIHLYAKWTSKAARINSTYFDTLAEAISVASNGQTIVVLKNLYENEEVPAGKSITIDLNNKTLSYGNGNVDNSNTIKNYGTLILKNGTVTNSASTNGCVNNYSGGTITFDNVNAIVNGAGNRQALYNEGTATIKNNSQLTSVASGRCAVTNKNATSVMNIIDATIISTGSCGLDNNGSLYIGNDSDSDVSSTNPSIRGITYGIKTTTNIALYDGVLKGKTKAIDNAAKITIFPSGYQVLVGSETIGSDTYETRYIGVGIVNKAKIGTVEYATLQDAINAATGSTPTTIEFIDDISESVTISSTQDIQLDIGTYTFSNQGTNPLITNNGHLTITNGTLSSNTTQGAINQVSGTLDMSGGQILCTGNRQAIYITGGTANISGSAYLSSKTSGVPTGGTMERATIQVVSGTLNITGGTIVATQSHAVSNEGTVNIGVEDGSVSTTSPVLQGKKYGIKSTGTLNFYDGIIKGETDAINGSVNALESGYQVTNGTDGNYTTAYLDAVVNPLVSPLSLDIMSLTDTNIIDTVEPNLVINETEEVIETNNNEETIEPSIIETTPGEEEVIEPPDEEETNEEPQVVEIPSDTEETSNETEDNQTDTNNETNIINIIEEVNTEDNILISTPPQEIVEQNEEEEKEELVSSPPQEILDKYEKEEQEQEVKTSDLNPPKTENITEVDSSNVDVEPELEQTSSLLQENIVEQTSPLNEINNQS